MAVSPGTQPGLGATASDVWWPRGPHYFDLTGSDGSTAWIRYRVWAADWYVHALRAAAGPTQSYDRLVGVEMAVDGALNSLSGAFDAAVAVLIEGAENRFDVDEDRRLQPHLYSWSRARKMLTHQSIGTTSDGTANDEAWRVVLDVDNALAGERDQVPTGWLAILRRLRNRVAHHNTLPRHHHDAGVSAVIGVGSGPPDMSDYLAVSCDQVHDLVEAMISLAIQLGAHELSGDSRRPRWSSERNGATDSTTGAGAVGAHSTHKRHREHVARDNH